MCNAIVEQAAKDYRWALRRLKHHPKDDRGRTVKWEVERFFRSDWYRLLTNVDANIIMKAIQKEVGVAA